MEYARKRLQHNKNFLKQSQESTAFEDDVKKSPRKRKQQEKEDEEEFKLNRSALFHNDKSLLDSYSDIDNIFTEILNNNINTTNMENIIANLRQIKHLYNDQRNFNGNNYLNDLDVKHHDCFLDFMKFIQDQYISLIETLLDRYLLI